MDLWSDVDVVYGPDSGNFGEAPKGVADKKPLVAFYESESSGSEGSVVAVGIMETLRRIQA